LNKRTEITEQKLVELEKLIRETIKRTYIAVEFRLNVLNHAHALK